MSSFFISLLSNQLLSVGTGLSGIVLTNYLLSENSVNKKRITVVDVCKILEECSIDEISKYLIEQGKKKKFPDITRR